MRGLVDIHHHFFSPGQKSRELKASHGHMTPKDRLQTWSPDRTIEHMDALGIATAVGSISTPGIWNGIPEEAAANAREWNEHAASLSSRHPGRFQFFATLPLPALDATALELEYSLSRLGAAGVSLFTNYDGRYLGDAAFSSTFDDLNRRGCVVYVHPTAPAYGSPIPGILPQVIEFAFETTRTILSLLVSGSLRRYPDIKWIFSHSGGSLSILADRIERLLNRAPYSEQNPDGIRPLIERLHFDIAGTEATETIDALRSIVPISQLLFGSDMPFAAPSKSVETIDQLSLTRAERYAVESGNARRLLGSQ